MANNEHINKVVKSTGETLIDLTSDTVTAGTLLKDVTAHDRSGAKIVGAVIVAPTDVTETEDNEAYLYKSSEHDAIYDELVGGSVAWNQLVANSGSSLSVTITSGHKYILKKSGTLSVGASSGSAITGLTGGTDWITDLTLMFGTTIADYVYNLEQSTAGSGVEWLKSYGFFTKDYYAYNAGGLVSVNVNGKKVVGKNLLRKLFSTQTKSNVTLTANSDGTLSFDGTASSLEYFPINFNLAAGAYTFTTGIDESFSTYDTYLSLAGTTLARGGNGASNNFTLERESELQITFRIRQGVSVNGLILYPMIRRADVTDATFEPYTTLTYPIQSTDLRGLYKLNGNKLYTDGDIYSADGQITRKYGYRGYQSGDESLANAITDGTYTIYKLSAPTTETASSYTSPQMVYRNGTEEYQDTRDVPMPVGGNRKYVDIPEWMVNEYFDDVRAETSTLKAISKLQQEIEVLRNALSQSTYFIPKGTTTITANTITDKTKCFYYIPNSVTSFGIYAFAGCDSLTSITIPNSVTSIGSSAFFYCTSLTSVTIPDSVTSIVDSMFFGCTNLKSVVIPNSVKSIQTLAFYKCTSLTNVTIPNSVTSIGSSAFEDCTSLREIAIPDSVTNINSTAFKNCTNLISITIDKPQGSISGAPWGAPNATVTWTG